MERTTPVRKPYTSTADLLTWSETPPSDSPAPVSVARSHQPSDGISKVVFGGQVTDEEVESLNKRKPCLEYKMKEITGSGIFVANGEDDTLEPRSANPPPNKTRLRMYQQAIAGISHISFGEEEGVSPKKPTTLPEVANGIIYKETAIASDKKNAKRVASKRILESLKKTASEE